jgi:UPF0271 protein
MTTIDLNSDIGESFGTYTMGMDAGVLKVITSANVACGWHAGDPMVMQKTVALAAQHGVSVGAHPGYPDLMGFGRRSLNCSLEEIRNYVIYQVGALQAFCRATGIPLAHVKPHGALYNTAVADPRVGRAIMEAVASVAPSLYYVALAGAGAEEVRRQAGEVGIRVMFEAFPDRAYTPEGRLAPRSQAGAVIHDPDEAARRALQMARDGSVAASDGTVIPLSAHTLCVHGDNPEALALVKAIRDTLTAAGITVRAMGEK